MKVKFTCILHSNILKNSAVAEAEMVSSELALFFMKSFETKRFSSSETPASTFVIT